MLIELQRSPSKNEWTLGKLSIDGKFECFTCEDAIRDAKVYGKTAIPAGDYKVTITMSNRFKVLLPLLHGVPNYEGVRIHPGNTAADTEGCILPGKGWNASGVTQSRVAFKPLFDKIKAALDKGEAVTIRIRNP